MASSINAAIPPFGAATTAGVRANFASAKSEIETLQTGEIENVILPNASGHGVKVDQSAPVFPWRDLIGDVTPKTSGVGAPTLAAFNGGNIRAFFYGAGEDGDIVFHIPHDYAPGTDLHLHVHWAHNGTAISGSMVVNFYFSYSKGHNQSSNGNFPAETTRTLTISTPDIATVPRYRHRVDETQITASSPTGSQINSNLIEPDGLLILHYDVTTIPTITGGSPNEPALFTIDIHYQSTSIGTKQKSPDFYAA